MAVYATALTYKLEAHERACFFTNVETKGTKVAFYFAVRPTCRCCGNHLDASIVSGRAHVIVTED